MGKGVMFSNTSASDSCWDANDYEREDMAEGLRDLPFPFICFSGGFEVNRLVGDESGSSSGSSMSISRWFF